MFYRRGHALVCFVLLLVFSGRLFSQTIVSTTPENRRAVIEEFGGMYCVYCPHGHDILAELDQGLDDQLILINYQTGPYATPIGNDPDLGNDYSDALEELSQLSGYPAATANRHVFPGLEQSVPGSTALGRNNWTEAVTEVLQESAPVNIAAEASVNISTRQLELYIEYYYTADAEVESNRLHVAVLQNNVLAPQHGGNAGSYYEHQHLFREFLTGQWGHIISSTSAGSFGSLTYNIDLPEYYRDVWVDPVNIELAIFITEDEQEVLNGIQVEPDLAASFASDANLLSIQAPEDICASTIAASLQFRNDGNTPLESCTIHYGIVGGFTESFVWSGEIAPLEVVSFDLPPIAVLTDQSSNDFFVELIDPNSTPDPSAYNNLREHHFTLAPSIEGNTFELALRTDEFGYEIYWEVVDDFGNIYASGGNEVVGETNGGAQIATPSDPGVYESNSFYVEEFFLPFEGCYQLRILDDYADGLCCYYGNGFYRLREPNEQPFLSGGEFGALKESYFNIGTMVTSTAGATIPDEDVTLYPNPLPRGSELQIQWPATPPSAYQWQLFRADGTLWSKGNQNHPPNSTQLPAGYYILHLQYPEKRSVHPFVIAQ